MYLLTMLYFHVLVYKLNYKKNKKKKRKPKSYYPSKKVG